MSSTESRTEVATAGDLLAAELELMERTSTASRELIREAVERREALKVAGNAALLARVEVELAQLVRAEGTRAVHAAALRAAVEGL